LIITRLHHRFGLKQETLWARFGELRKAHDQRERERQQKESEQQESDRKPVSGFVELKSDAAMPTTERPRGTPKTGLAAAAERQLVELLLGDPALVPVAAAQLTVQEITHTGLQRILAELYAVHAAGAVADLEALRARLEDRPDLYEAAQKLQFIGQQMQDREEWLQRLLKRFAEMKAQAAARVVKEQLASASEDQAAELLRKLQQTRTQPPRRSAG